MGSSLQVEGTEISTGGQMTAPSYYRKLSDLKEMVDKAIEKYGEDMPYILTAAYGADGDMGDARESEDGSFVYFPTDICTG